MKLLMISLMLGFSILSSVAFASEDVIVTCAGRNQSTRNYSTVDWRTEYLNSTPKRQYLTFATGSALLLAASTVNNQTVVTIKGSLFEFDKTAQRTLIVQWDTGATATARDSNGNFETVTCYFQHDDSL